MSEIKLYAHHVEGLSYTKAITATPFVALPDGSFELREPVIEAGVIPAPDLASADVACLPAFWDTYDQPDHRQAAVDLIEQAGRAGKHVAVWVAGDDEIDMPWPNVIQFQHTFRRSRQAATTRRALPVMFSDLITWTFDGKFEVQPKGRRPSVGFCGQGRSTVAEGTKRMLLKAETHARRGLGHSEALPEPMRSHVALRRRTLHHLAADPRIDTNFIIRNRYRGGLTDAADKSDNRHAANYAFFCNIRDTQYTVCVRGGGNFSVRLYETLCSGRIPLILDTDGILPWPDHPFWTESALVVPADEMATLGDRLLAHHDAVDDDGWAQRQHAARSFWLDWLSRPGYLSHLPELLQAGPGR